jgi:hypothetical protein
MEKLNQGDVYSMQIFFQRLINTLEIEIGIHFISNLESHKRSSL